MPKGKKKGKKKGKSNSEKKDMKKNLSAQISDSKDDIFEDKEELLKEKFFTTIKEIENVKAEIEIIKEENNILHNECEKVRSETETFSNFLNDREDHKRNNLVTLHDYHGSMIEYYNSMREQMLSEFDSRKKELQVLLNTKENRIVELDEEVHKYDEDLVVRENQQKEIMGLENQIRNIRSQQAVELEKMKVHLITEHQRVQQESNEKINEIARAAYKEAINDLSNTFKNIESENRELRQEMLWTIRQNKTLNLKKIELQEENCGLKEELQYVQDFASFRLLRQEKPKLLEETKKK